MSCFISGYTIKVKGAESGIVKLKFDLFIPTKVKDVLSKIKLSLRPVMQDLQSKKKKEKKEKRKKKKEKSTMLILF
jgi:hypothetical protein